MVKVGESLPFQEAIDFFKQKVNLPTKTWKDVQNGAHARAFVVASTNKEDLLSDFRTSVDKAISQGISLQEFRKDFDKIVSKHGWSYKGSRGWRSETIYATNVQTAYAAGRYKQMTDPDVLSRRPYWQYLLGDSKKHRPEHVRWNGLILPADDPFWKTHYPPNDWGCKCRVRTLSEGDLKRMGVSVSTISDKERYSTKGIGDGWKYNLGEAAYGNPFVEDVFSKDWENASIVESSAYQKASDDLPVRQTNVRPLPENLSNVKECREEISKICGGTDVYLKDKTGSDVFISSKNLPEHILKSNHTKHIPFMKDIIEDPEEIWAVFEKHSKTGKYRIRKTYVKQIVEASGKPMVLIAEGEKGVFKGITSYVKDNVNKVRNGLLIYKK